MKSDMCNDRSRVLILSLCSDSHQSLCVSALSLLHGGLPLWLHHITVHCQIHSHLRALWILTIHLSSLSYGPTLAGICGNLVGDVSLILCFLSHWFCRPTGLVWAIWEIPEQSDVAFSCFFLSLSLVFSVFSKYLSCCRCAEVHKEL